MRVNERKTQMLCIHANHNNIISSYINADNGKIESTDYLRILGFDFNNEPNAIFHVLGVIDKLYGKLWTLRFLKKSGMSQNNLLQIYCSVLRPSAEYSSIIYNSLIPEYVSAKLEAVQRQAMKIIYGWDINYDELISNNVISTLKSRREDASLKFAFKASKSPRFGPVWFTENPVERSARCTTRKHYIEENCRTERGRNNPIQYMTRMLNEHLASEASTAILNTEHTYRTTPPTISNRANQLELE